MTATPPAPPPAPEPPALDPGFRDGAIKVLAALEIGDTKRAFALMEELRGRAVAEQPREAGLAYHLAALVSLRLDEIAKTLSAFETAHGLASDTRQHIEALAIMNARLGRVVEALYYAKLATAAGRRLDIPGLLPAWMGSFEAYFYRIEDEPVRKRAEVAAKEHDWEAARKFYRQVIELDAEDPAGWRGLAEAEWHLDRPYDALEALLSLHKLVPDHVGDVALLGRTMAKLGEWDQAADCFRHAASFGGEDTSFAWAPICGSFDRPSTNLAGDAEATLASAAAAWSLAARARIAPASGMSAMPVPPPSLGGGRLKLGVLTRRWDLRDGLETVVPLLMALPRHSIELHVYADGYARTPLARRVRGAAASWQEIAELDDETLSFILGNEGLDALIDLDGPLRRGRLGVYLRHPVALQISLGDAPASAGACGFDAVLGDRWTHPIETGVPVLRVDGVAASLPTDLVLLTEPVTRATVGSRRTVYGSAAGPGRITPEAVTLWAEILTRREHAVLRLSVDAAGGPNGAQAVLEQFKSRGLGQRLEFDPEGGDWQAYLASVDVLLDPPGNPAPEEAWVAAAGGVPVVSMAGTLPASRVLYGWLNLIGQDNLAATDADSYIALAVAAGTPETLAMRRMLLSAAVASESTDGARRRAVQFDTVLRAHIAKRTQPGQEVAI